MQLQTIQVDASKERRKERQVSVNRKLNLYFEIINKLSIKTHANSVNTRQYNNGPSQASAQEKLYINPGRTNPEACTGRGDP